MSTLRTLTAEEVSEAPRRYTMDELRLRMRFRVRDLDFAGDVAEIVILDVSEPPHEQIWLKFGDIEKPVGPYQPNEIYVIEQPVEQSDTTTSSGT